LNPDICAAIALPLHYGCLAYPEMALLATEISILESSHHSSTVGSDRIAISVVLVKAGTQAGSVQFSWTLAFARETKELDRLEAITP
jgi:hypothetical protein